MSKAVEGTIKDKQEDYGIHRVTRFTLKSESFVKKITKRILEEENIFTSFATHAKIHVDKIMDDWRVTTNWAKPSPNYPNL